MSPGGGNPALDETFAANVAAARDTDSASADVVAD